MVEASNEITEDVLFGGMGGKRSCLVVRLVALAEALTSSATGLR